MSLQALQRVQAILDETNAPTDYSAFTALLNDLAHYARSKSWHLVNEAMTSVDIVDRREAA